MTAPPTADDPPTSADERGDADRGGQDAGQRAAGPGQAIGTAWVDRPAHRRWLAGESDRLLAFSIGSVDPAGGFGWLDDDGRLTPGRAVETWISTRMTHVFAVGHLLAIPGCASLVDHGIAALRTVLADEVDGGWYAAADRRNGGEKRAYEHAFVLLAAASATVAGRPGAHGLFADVEAVILDHFWDDERGVLVDVWDRSWTAREPYGGANANMHAVEAFLSAADTTGDATWRERALRIAGFFIDRHARAHDWRIPEHFDAEWNEVPDYNRAHPAHPFRPYGATIGHGFEWARLCLHLHASCSGPSLGDAAPGWLVEAARGLFDRAVSDGWRTDGFVYTTDWTGKPVVDDRLHWVVCEAIAAAAALGRVTGEPRYEACYRQWWDVAERFFVDRRRGSWRAQLDAGNTPATTVWSGKPDTYHAFQATLLPRLPLHPSLASSVATGMVDVDRI